MEKEKKKRKRKKRMIIQVSKAITRYKNDTTLPKRLIFLPL
jgi:hypothetical protein